MTKVPARVSLDLTSERSLFQLAIPSRDPFVGTERLVDFLEVITQLVILSLYLLTAMIVHVILPAVPCLILIGKSRVKWSCLDFKRWLGLGFRSHLNT